LLVLCYHRVLAESDPMRPFEISRVQFESQMAFLERGFNVLPLSEALSLREQGRLPRRAVSITFDDGYADNATQALPVLKRYGLPATVFVACDYLDGGRMWNDSVIEAVRSVEARDLDLRELGLDIYPVATPEQQRETATRIVGALKYAPPKERTDKVEALTAMVGASLPADLMLSHDQLQALIEGGVEIGAHTRRHPILTRLSDQEASAEISESKSILEGLTGRPVRLFAYPNGRPHRDYDQRHVRMVRESGYLGAVSTSHGAFRPGHDEFEIPRIAPWAEQVSKFGFRIAASYRA
jgi:peptidoglycan/xylan/chitin deacetylase (PgdA/CDA1 family)